MDRQELIDNLGTVARSGTRAFISRLAEAAKDKEGPRTDEGRRRPDRPVRRRLLLGLHGGGPHRGDQPPRRIGRSLGVALGRRRRLRDRAGERRAGRARAARHRDRAAPQGRREGLSRAARDRADRARPIRTTSCSRSSSPAKAPKAPKEAGASRSDRKQIRAAPDQHGERDLAAAEIRAHGRRTTPRPIMRSASRSTSRR